MSYKLQTNSKTELATGWPVGRGVKVVDF